MGNEWDWLEAVLGWFVRTVVGLFDRSYAKKKARIEDLSDEEVVV